jgi:hypothetical protein
MGRVPGLPDHYFGNFLASAEFLWFPREGLRDSWEVGLWRADQWTWIGKPSSTSSHGLQRNDSKS